MSIETETQDVADALRDPVPVMQDPGNTSVQLQRGLIDPVTGLWQTQAEVREMTGADEEYMSSVEAKSDVTYGDYISTLLKRTVVSIGSISLEHDKSQLDNVSLGDRDLLFLGVIQATYGKTKEFQAECRKCATANDITVDLQEDFPVRKPDVDLQKPIKVKLRNGKFVQLRIPTIGDSAYVAKKASSVAAQNTLMLSRCAVWEDGKQPSDVEEWARSLNVSDRNKLVKGLLEIEAGPELKAVNTQCASCGEDMAIALDWVSLLLV